MTDELRYGPALWYLNRGSGIVLLVALTLTTGLGVLSTARLSTPGWPRFATQTLHRNVAVISTGLLVAHVLAAVFDDYVPIRRVDLFLPFTCEYEPALVGLGALALDLLCIVLLSGLLRRRFPPGPWRAVHALGYAAWGAGAAHGLGLGTDTRDGWGRATALACVGFVGLTALVRLTTWSRERRPAT